MIVLVVYQKKSKQSTSMLCEYLWVDMCLCTSMLSEKFKRSMYTLETCIYILWTRCTLPEWNAAIQELNLILYYLCVTIPPCIWCILATVCLMYFGVLFYIYLPYCVVYDNVGCLMSYKGSILYVGMYLLHLILHKLIVYIVFCSLKDQLKVHLKKKRRTLPSHHMSM